MDSYIQMVFALGAVLGLLLIFYGIALRRRQTERGLINIIAYRVLDAKRGVAVAVMKIGEELLFVGVTPGDMKVLKTLPFTEAGYASKDSRFQNSKDLRHQTSDILVSDPDLRSLSSAIRKRLNENN